MCYNPKTIAIQTNYPVGEVMSTYYDDEGTEWNWVKMQVPCGQCLECLEEYSRVWAHRVMDEVQCHNENCFITLTYEDNPYCLVPEDFTNFLKRLRKHLEPLKIRYFYAAEYGSKGKRPHAHMMIFGWRPKDLKFLKCTAKGSMIYTSEEVSSIWKKGFVSVGDINPHTAKYSAKYLQKMQKVPDDFVKPYVRMSTHPGIGYLKINPRSLATDKIWHQGEWIKIPRYYLNKLEPIALDLVAATRLKRIEKGEKLKRSPESLERARKKCENLLTTKLNPL